MIRLAFITRLLLLALAITHYTAANAQFVDAEPNNLCLEAQNIGVFSRPTSTTGSLDSTPISPDVDFFAFEADADELIQVDLEGAFTNAGTLANPLLGLFNSECVLIAANDDSGGGQNSRLVVTVPYDGTFILGVTECCDYDFAGGGLGSYLLTLDNVKFIDSISGRLVNADPGDPGPIVDPAYASVYLLRCSGGDCYEYVGYQQADIDGRFTFQQDWYGNPLTTGTYRIEVQAYGFENFTSEPFDVAEGEARDLGELGLTPIQIIGSVSGRLIDVTSGDALSGYNPPYAYVNLERCEDWGCYPVVGIGADDSGYFRFDGVAWFLQPGTYQLSAYAQDYRTATSNQFTVAADEDIDFGDFALTPYPLQFGATQACDLPFGGETCTYSIEVTNRGTDRRYKGQAWSSVQFYDPANNYAETRFQVGRGGIENPKPENLNLKRGQTETLSFELDIPSSVPIGSLICAFITAGQKPAAQFSNQGSRFIFCSQKDSSGVIPMPEKEGRKRLHELRQRDRESGGGPEREFEKRHDRKFKQRQSD